LVGIRFIQADAPSRPGGSAKNPRAAAISARAAGAVGDIFPSARQASSIRKRGAGPEIASIRSDGSIPAADSGRIATPQAPGGQLRQHQRVGRLEGDVRLHPDAGAALLQRGSHSRAARHADQRFLDQRPQRHFPALGQAVSVGHGRHEPIIEIS
jgi:hypothetical protein